MHLPCFLSFTSCFSCFDFLSNPLKRLVMLINEIFWNKVKMLFCLACNLWPNYRAQNQRACMLQLSKSTRTSVRKVSRSHFWSPLEILFVVLPFSHSTWSVDNPVVFSVWRVVLRLFKILALLASHSSNLYVALKKVNSFYNTHE